MDILDTLALRGMKKEEIQTIASRRPVGVSPFSVYEMLCHLDESEPGEAAAQTFARRQGWFAKLDDLEILHDPFAQHATAVGADSLANPSRFEDRDCTKQLVRECVQASSRNDLYRRTVRLSNGSTGSIRDIAVRAQAALKEEEQQYEAAVRNMWDRLKKHGEMSCPAKLTDNELWEWLKAVLQALRQSYERDGVAVEALLVKIARSMYPYFGYVFERLRKYSENRAGELIVPANDTEDACIAMHMDLLAEDVLVTNDKNTRDALNTAFDLWKKRVSPRMAPVCTVMCPQEYQRRFGAKT